MKLIPYDYKEAMKKKRYKPTRNLGILEEFIESGLDCVKLEGYDHKNAETATSSFKSSIKYYGMTNVECFYRKDEVFLIRKKV